MTPRLRGELGVLVAVAALVPVIWVLLGWRGELLGAHDSALYFLLLERSGDRAYDPSILGGIATTGVYGMPLFPRLESVVAFNVSVILTQVLHGVLGAFAAVDLAVLLGGPALADARAHRAIPLGVALAFAPVLGWRLSYGHLNLVWATFLVTAPLALIAAARVRRLTPLMLLLAIVALMHTFHAHGFQVMLYAALFGSPLLIAIALHRARPREAFLTLAVPALVVLIAIMLSMPALRAMLGYALGPDSTRRAGDAAGYTYLTGTWRDVVTSIPWAPLGNVRAESAHHETHYAFGAPLVLLLFFPYRRAPWIAAALLFSLVAAVLFATDVRPISTWLLKLPLMGAFRVPLRALLVFTIALPIVAVAGALTRPPQHHRLRFAPLVLAPALFVSPPLLRELVAFVMVLIAFDPRVLTALLAAGSIAAFKDKLLRFPTRAALLDDPRALATLMRKKAPDIVTPLDRVSLQLASPVFGPNTAWAAGLSSIDGYSYPSRRFLALTAAVQGTPYDAQYAVLFFDPSTPAFRIMGQLYNVRVIMFPSGNILRPGPTAGAAWFSARTERVPSVEALADRLRAPDLSTVVHDVAWLVGDDGPTEPFQCDGKVLHVSTRGTAIAISTSSASPCPLTISTNYLSILRGRIDGQPAELFPSYFALTGVVVPPGQHEVVLE